MNDTRIPPAPVTGIYGALLKAGSRKMLGKVPSSLGVMWRHRAVLKDYMTLGRKSEKWGALDPTLASLATMAAAAGVGCSFCLDLQYFLAHHRHLDEAKAREVPRWRSSTVFTPLERRVLEYAEAMCQTPVEVSDELSDALLADLGASWTSSHPTSVSVADGGGKVRGAARHPIVGAAKLVAYLAAVLQKFGGHPVARPVPVNGGLGALVEIDGAVAAVLSVVIEEGHITQIYSVANPDKLARLDVGATVTR